jgi:hypothetical protein
VSLADQKATEKALQHWALASICIYLHHLHAHEHAWCSQPHWCRHQPCGELAQLIILSSERQKRSTSAHRWKIGKSSATEILSQLFASFGIDSHHFAPFPEIKQIVTPDELLQIFIELNGLDQDVEAVHCASHTFFHLSSPLLTSFLTVMLNIIVNISYLIIISSWQSCISLSYLLYFYRSLQSVWTMQRIFFEDPAALSREVCLVGTFCM